MSGQTFRKHAGITTTVLFLVIFIPSVLSQAEGTTDRAIGATVSARPEGTTAAGIGAGTIAMGTAITEAALIAVAAPQQTSTNPVTVH